MYDGVCAGFIITYGIYTACRVEYDDCTLVYDGEKSRVIQNQCTCLSIAAEANKSRVILNQCICLSVAAETNTNAVAMMVGILSALARCLSLIHI